MKRTQNQIQQTEIMNNPFPFFDQHNKMGSCAHTFPVASNKEFASHPANITHKIKRGTALLKIWFWFQKAFNLKHGQLVCLLDPIPTTDICWLAMKGLQKSKCILGRRCNGLQIERGATLLQLDVFCSGCCCRRLFCSYGW
jgi:hypothetical protein